MMKYTPILALAILLVLFCGSAYAAPAMSAPKVTPSAGQAGDTFTFTVRYTGEEPTHVQLFLLGEEGMDMLEVDPLDSNTTNGKDYYLDVELPEGTVIYHFKATLGSGEEARTSAATLFVGSAGGIRLDHLDVVFAVLLFLIPTTWGLFMFRKFSGDMKKLLDRMEERDKKSE